MSLTSSILIGVATRIGAPVVKALLEKHVGGAAADVGGTIIDAIADRAGVPPEQLERLPEADLEAAVRSVEDDAPALLAAWNTQQAQTHDLLKAEMAAGQQDGAPWTWWWRPAGMYLLGAVWFFYAVLVPLINLVMALLGSSARLEMIVDVTMLLTISGGFITLYMGGHTLLRGIETWKRQA